MTSHQEDDHQPARARHDVVCDDVRPQPTESIGQVLTGLARHPIDRLVRRWNWKSALLSSASRAALFFGANLSAGLDAALAAMLTELLFRAATAGFYGALTQALSRATPRWAGTAAALVVLPIAGHALELLVHWQRGTENLAASILVSCLFTTLSTLFNLFAMRRGALVVGAGRASLGQDLRRMPRLILAFIAEPARLAVRAARWFVRRLSPVAPLGLGQTGAPRGELP